MSKRTYKIQKMKSGKDCITYYLCLPHPIVTENMLKCGVKIDVIHKDIGNDEVVIAIRADMNGKHSQSNRKS